MIDLHSHVLPGIDDGADTFALAVEMCQMAAADGVEALVATPHQRTPTWDNRDPQRLAGLLAELQDRTGEHPRLLPGAEIRIGSGLLAEIDAIPASGLLPLAGSRYLLLELDRHDPRADAAGLAHELMIAGWVPVFAHPELIPLLADDLSLMHRLAERGALFQLTAMSVTGDFGPHVRDTCAEMLDAGLAHFVASDAHDTRRRPPGLTRAYRVIANGWGEETARSLTHDHPLAVVERRPLPVTAGAVSR